jgi:hypothetical protein
MHFLFLWRETEKEGFFSGEMLVMGLCWWICRGKNECVFVCGASGSDVRSEWEWCEWMCVYERIDALRGLRNGGGKRVIKKVWLGPTICLFVTARKQKDE